MKKYFITLCTYPKNHKVRIVYEKKTRPRFIKYCQIHGFEFVEITKNEAAPYEIPFAKIFWINKNMGRFNDGDVITYMDIDCCIMDGRFPAVFDADFSIVQESTGILCMGTWSIRISEWSRRFINEMCSDKLQEINKGLSHWNTWQDNDAIFQILGLEWGQDPKMMGTRNTTPFTKEELEQHIKILPANWGCTFHPDDTNLFTNIGFNGVKDSNKTYRVVARFVKKERYCPFDEIIVRHLAAGTMMLPWADRYYNKKMKI
jgi:hypothetical protein